ncbi:CLUMA_CG001440, isoform A [Clunio marinus]|uniref:CLUMA_CG001440, isoform A n=1 Tax=Clunio marinus TaxID=568069 RepID=A0A1J1HJQ7_9DIPT|nr:CLUMA_CG001440, isoform A [Clunio marinus]
MEVSKALKLLLFLGSFILLRFSYAERIKSISSIVCLGSNKTVVISECSVKPVSKHQSGINIVMDFLTKVNKAMLYYEFWAKKGKTFRIIAKGDDVELCRFFNGTNDGIMRFAMGILKKFRKKSLGPCPKEVGNYVLLLGHHELLNITLRKPADKKKVAPASNYRSNKTVVISECSVKPVSKHQSGFNVVLDFITKVYKLMINYEFGAKLGKSFRTIVKGDDVEICRFFNGTNVGLMKYAINVLANLPEKSLGPCPKEGHHEFLNITIGGAVDKTVGPTNSYSIFIQFHNENDDNIASIKLFLDIFSVKD